MMIDSELLNHEETQALVNFNPKTHKTAAPQGGGMGVSPITPFFPLFPALRGRGGEGEIGLGGLPPNPPVRNFVPEPRR